MWLVLLEWGLCLSVYLLSAVERLIPSFRPSRGFALHKAALPGRYDLAGSQGSGSRLQSVTDPHGNRNIWHLPPPLPHNNSERSLASDLGAVCKHHAPQLENSFLLSETEIRQHATASTALRQNTQSNMHRKIIEKILSWWLWQGSLVKPNCSQIPALSSLPSLLPPMGVGPRAASKESLHASFCFEAVSQATRLVPLS